MKLTLLTVGIIALFNVVSCGQPGVGDPCGAWHHIPGTDCKRGLVCVNGKCKAKLGEKCWKNDDCVTI